MTTWQEHRNFSGGSFYSVIREVFSFSKKRSSHDCQVRGGTRSLGLGPCVVRVRLFFRLASARLPFLGWWTTLFFVDPRSRYVKYQCDVISFALALQTNYDNIISYVRMYSTNTTAISSIRPSNLSTSPFTVIDRNGHLTSCKFG
jgi:hypothetical protein